MNYLEAIGFAFVILTSALGCLGILFFAWRGLHAVPLEKSLQADDFASLTIVKGAGPR